ncbi:MAG: DUF2971 domain-containing protein [Balneolales bacterium]
MSYKFRSLILRDTGRPTPELQEKIDDFSQSWSKYHELQPGKKLFHYTDIGGLQGIVESKQLWFSHLSSLNDPHEVEYGKKIINEEINSRLVGEDNKNIRFFYDSIKQIISGFGRTLHHAFVCCFCEEANLLSQWREYSDRGGGYSLGFEFNENTMIFFNQEDYGNSFEKIKSTPQPLLRKVIYDVEEQNRLVKVYLDEIKKGYDAGINGKVESRFRTKDLHAAVMGAQSVDILLDMIFAFKNPAFKEEKEWRLMDIVMDNHDPENFSFRNNAKMLVPFRKTYLANVTDDCYFPLNL